MFFGGRSKVQNLVRCHSESRRVLPMTVHSALAPMAALTRNLRAARPSNIAPFSCRQCHTSFVLPPCVGAPRWLSLANEMQLQPCPLDAQGVNVVKPPQIQRETDARDRHWSPELQCIEYTAPSPMADSSGPIRKPGHKTRELLESSDNTWNSLAVRFLGSW